MTGPIRLPAAAALALGLGLAGCGLKTQELAPGVAAAVGEAPLPGAGIIRTGFGTVVVDGQPSERLGEDLKTAAEKFAGYPVTYLILTSHHADHALSNRVFLRAEIISTAAARRMLDQKLEAERALLPGWLATPGVKSAEAVTPTLTFEKQLTLWAGWPKEKIREIRLLELPAGAASGNLVVLLPKEKVLFAGDLVVNGVFPYMADADVAGWLKALDELDKLDFEKLVPGHGAPGGRELLGVTRKLLLDLSAAVERAKATGKPLAEVKPTFALPGYEKWAVVKELLPLALERLWDQKLPPAPAAPAAAAGAPAAPAPAAEPAR
jgi:cyclase